MVCLSVASTRHQYEGKKPHITDLGLHYDDEFADIHEEFMENLQEKDSSGITFLHGLPGTGKTYYLRPTGYGQGKNFSCDVSVINRRSVF